MQQYFHLTGVLGRWLYAARRLALLERATGSKPPRRWLYLAVFRISRSFYLKGKYNWCQVYSIDICCNIKAARIDGSETG